MKPIPSATPAISCRAGCIVFFDEPCTLSPAGLMDSRGVALNPMLADLVRRYLDAAADATTPLQDGWCSFRELSGAGPLAVNFANNTNKTIATTFGGDLAALDRAAAGAGGHPETDTGFDRRYCFQALPQVPLILNYNAADDLFPAQAQLLFRRCAQYLLGIRDLLTLATFLTGRLIGSARRLK